MQLKHTDEHESIIGYTIEVYKDFGVHTPSDLDVSRRAILNLIDAPGRLIDLGCGCGYFLSYLVQNSIHRIVPYGVDIDEISIDQAQELVLPHYRENFFVADIEQFVFSIKFDYIIVNPLYIGNNFVRSFEYYYKNLNPGGKLVLMITNDTLPRMKDWTSIWSFLSSKNLRWVQMNPLTLGFVVKNHVTESHDLETPIRVKDLLKLGGSHVS